MFLELYMNKLVTFLECRGSKNMRKNNGKARALRTPRANREVLPLYTAGEQGLGI